MAKPPSGPRGKGHQRSGRSPFEKRLRAALGEAGQTGGRIASAAGRKPPRGPQSATQRPEAHGAEAVASAERTQRTGRRADARSATGKLPAGKAEPPRSAWQGKTKAPKISGAAADREAAGAAVKLPKPGQMQIFLAVAPGLEDGLAEEVRAAGFRDVAATAGGATISGGWPDVWRANLVLRGPSRIIAPIGEFRALHLAQLDKRARRLPWREVIGSPAAIRVEATCAKSRIYHSGAAAERVGTAAAAALGCAVADAAEVTIRVHIEDDLCRVGLDTSGELLHKRGHKEAVAKAPMRETFAALLLRACGYDGREPVLDPMCGSGTLVIEAAEIALGLLPGRSRRFAFERLATFDADEFARVKSAAVAAAARAAAPFKLLGSDRDAGAIAMSRANAERAGVSGSTSFAQLAVSEVARPDGPAGLVICNPPYGTRIGDKKQLAPLYRALGQMLVTRFSGWRVGLITTEPDLARSTGLPFLPPGPPIAHGGLRVTLYRTNPLP